MSKIKLSLIGEGQALIITEGIKGAIKWFAALYFLGIVLLAVGIVAFNHLSPRDSSDTETERSGMTVRTDALTGCQYLESSKGFLTPRLDGDNMPVCGEDARP